MEELVDVDRRKALTLGVPISDVYATLQTQLGSFYVNDFNKFGRTYQVKVQAEPKFRVQAADINQEMKQKVAESGKSEIVELNPDETKLASGYAFLTLKPMIVVLNHGEGEEAPAAVVAAALPPDVPCVVDPVLRPTLAPAGVADTRYLVEDVAQRLQQRDCVPGFLLDGYPRTVAQAEAPWLAAISCRPELSSGNCSGSGSYPART